MAPIQLYDRASGRPGTMKALTGGLVAGISTKLSTVILFMMTAHYGKIPDAVSDAVTSLCIAAVTYVAVHLAPVSRKCLKCAG